MHLPGRGVSSGGLRGLEHPPKVWHNSHLNSCVTTIVTEKQQLVAKTNNKLTGLTLNGSFSSLLGLKQPSLSSSCPQERVNEGRGQRFVGVAKNFARALRAFGSAPTFLKSWTRPCLGSEFHIIHLTIV